MPLKCKMDACSVCQKRGWAQERPLGLLLVGILTSTQQRYLPSLAVVAVPLAQYAAWCSPTGEGSPPGDCFKLERDYISKAW